MRRWSKPEWLVNQEENAVERGFAMVRNHGPGRNFLKLTWRSPKVTDQEGKDSIFRLKDSETGREYYLDAEELRFWMKYV